MSAQTQRLVYWTCGIAAVVVALWLLFGSGHAFAADKAAGVGGDCCADLEERIAELEATTARKGNRKVSLTVYGEINKSVMYWDVEVRQHGGVRVAGVNKFGPWHTVLSSNDWQVIDNSALSSFVGFKGTAKISPELSAGFVIELGVGGYDDGGSFAGSTNDLYVQRSYVFLTSTKLGTLSLGHASQATDEMDRITTANTVVAVRPFSGAPMYGPQTAEILDLFDGNRGDVVRYDSPLLFKGLILSGSIASGGASGNDDAWDVAAKYAGTFDQFRVAAAIGYRDGVIANGGGTSQVITGGGLDLATFTGVLSVMHLPTGAFLTGNVGKGNGSFGIFGFDTQGWALTGGVEEKWIAVGKTTLFGEYGDIKVDGSQTKSGWTNSLDAHATYWGGGVVQAIDAAAMDVYANIRFYNADADTALVNAVNTGFVGGIEADATVATVGAHVRF